MLDHLIDPDIPTKREEIEYDIQEKLNEIRDLENKIVELEDDLECAEIEWSDLCILLHALEPDPYRER